MKHQCRTCFFLIPSVYQPITTLHRLTEKSLRAGLALSVAAVDSLLALAEAVASEPLACLTGTTTDEGVLALVLDLVESDVEA